MAKKRFILNKNYNSPLEIEVAPTLVQTLDETLDNMTVVLKANTNPNPITPLQVFEVQEYSSGTWKTIIPLLVSADNVEVFSTKPLLYKHTLSLIQRHQYLTKHLIRNTVFSTSLQGDNFITTASQSIYQKIKVATSHPYWGAFNNFAPFNANYMEGIIYLRNKTISSINMEINFKAQITKNMGGYSGWQSYTYQAFQKTIYPQKWLDLYEGAENPGSIGGFPTITFVHNVSGESKTWNLNVGGTYNAINKSIVKVPQTIIDWANSKNEGYITISINDVDATNHTFLMSSAFTNNDAVARINYARLRLDFNVRSTENSVLYVLDTLLKQYMKETADYNSSNDATIKPLFLLPTEEHNPDLYNLLRLTSSPNFIFTQTNMFDAISEIFKLFDATFTIDADGYLDIEYYNDQTQTSVSITDVVGNNSSITEDKFATSSIAYFQNTKVIDRFPNSNERNAAAPIRSRTIGVPGQEDYVFITPKPIDIVLRAYMTIGYHLNNKTFALGSEGYGDATFRYYYQIVFDTENQPLDITSCIVEKSLWSLLPTTSVIPINGNWNEKSMYNSLSYTRGTNFIDVSGSYTTTFNMRQTIIKNVIKTAIAKETGWGASISDSPTDFTFSQPDFKELKFGIEYIALTDGRLQIESLEQKYKGEILSNQTNGSIDINKLGVNMEGLNLKIGQPTLNLTFKFCSWEERIRKGQFFFDEYNQKWVANVCAYTFLSSEVISTNVQFVKNFNGLSQRIQLAREKRLSNISNELTTKCEDNYNEYVYYYTSSSSSVVSEKIALANSSMQTIQFFNSIAMTFNVALENRLVGTGTTPYTPISIVPTSTGFNDFNNLSGDAKTIYSGIGYVGNIIDSTIGQILIRPNSDLTGTSINVRFSNGSADAITFDAILQSFVFTQVNDFSSYNIQVGNRINFFVIKDGTSIVGVAISAITYSGDIYPTPTNFSSYSMRSYIFQNTYKVEYATITPRDSKGNTFLVDGNERANIFIPLVVYGSGNSVCFEMAFDSPISAGNQLLTDYESDLWNDGYFSRAVLYTDNEGFADQFDINFVKLQGGITQYFPEAKLDALNTYIPFFSFGGLTNYKFYKKPNEIFGLNYQLHFLPLPDRLETDFLSNEFIKNNGFANGLSGKKFYLFYSTTEKYSIFDIKGRENDEVKELTSTTNLSTASRKLVMQFIFGSVANYEEVSSWAICDENDNIYFASNTPLKSTTSCEIVFVTRHHRI